MNNWRQRRYFCNWEVGARLLIVALGALGSIGCDQTFATPRTSADVDTKELGLYVSARSNGVVTHVFAEPMDKYGFVPLGPTDQLLVVAPGQTEKPFAVTPRSEKIAQIPGDSTSFSIVFVRKGKRFTTKVELPPRFSLEAHYQESAGANQLSIATNWTPNGSGSTMFLSYIGPKGRHDPPKDVEGAGGSWVIQESELKRPEYPYRATATATDDTIVIATRQGGKVTLDPALATIPHGGQLEQIRTTLVGPPPPPPVPPAQVATDPAQ